MAEAISSMSAAEADPEKAALELHGVEMWLGSFVLALGTFIVSLDLTIVNVILPHIASGYGATPNEGTLTISFFAAAQALIMPLTGWLSQRFGIVKVYIWGIVGFGVTSLACGLAHSLPMLIAMRTLQGLTAGPILPLVQALLQRSFSAKQMPTVFTLWSVAVATGPLAGPILGGFLADTVGWSWAFFINVPITVICGVITWNVFMPRESKPRKVPVDYIGLCLLVVWVGMFQFVLDKGREYEWFDSRLIVAALTTGVLAFVSFLIWELTEAHPLIDFSVLRYRSFRICTPITSISNATQTAGALLLGLWLQTNLDYSATEAGKAIASMGIPALLAGPLVAICARRFDGRKLITFGLAATGLNFLWRAALPSDADYFHIVLPVMFYGFCAPFSYGPLLAMAMREVPTAQLASASGLLAFSRAYTTAILVASTTTWWQDGITRAHSLMAGTLHLPREILGHAVTATSTRELTLIEGMLQRESVTISTQNMLIFLGLAIGSGAVLIWFCPPPTHGVATARE